MCKAILIGNDESSVRSQLTKPLAGIGIEVVAATSWSKLHQADPGVAEVAIWNSCGLPGKGNDIAARVKKWDLPLLEVFANRRDERKLDAVLRWQGARGERKAAKTGFSPAVEVAPPAPPPAPKGPPCVVCGKPVTEKAKGGSNWGQWLKTCSKECLSAYRRELGRRAGFKPKSKAKTEPSPVDPPVQAPIPTAAAEVVVTTDMVQWNYKGTMIGMTEDRFLDMTAMWRAVGRPENRAPKDYLRTEQAERLMVQIAEENQKVVSAHLFRAESGRNGCTRAHWKLALDYAMYLNPAFKSWCYDRLLPLIGEEMGIASAPQPKTAMTAMDQWELALNAHKELAAKTEANERDIADMRKRQDELEDAVTRPSVVDEDAIAGKAAERATEKLAATWTERDRKRRRVEPGPQLPNLVLERDIGSSSSILYKMRGLAERLIQDLVEEGIDVPRDYVTNRINTRMRIVATGTYKARDLTRGSLGTLPMASLEHILNAIDDEDVSDDVKADVRKMAVIKGW